MNLLELRKYAIRRRVEIRFGDPLAAQECMISEKGQVKIPGEEKDFRVEDALNAAEKFVIGAGGNAQRLTREAMARALDEEASAGGGATSHAEEEE
jgi:hypothetical protein